VVTEATALPLRLPLRHVDVAIGQRFVRGGVGEVVGALVRAVASKEKTALETTIVCRQQFFS
jgi:hypothetical protein